MTDIDRLVESISADSALPLYLVGGDRVVSEPAGRRIADRLAELAGATVEVHKRPEDLSALVADLQTLGLFTTGKVIVAVDTSVVADRGAAAGLIDQAARALPLAAAGETELTAPERRAARSLFQALRLFQVDPYGGSGESAVSRLPAWALAGGPALRKNRSRGRSKKQVEKLREDLAQLVVAGRAAEIQGTSEDVLALLSELLDRGLPEGHHLVLVESSVAADHPLVTALAERSAFVELSRVTSGRRGWEGLEPLVEELARETGVDIDRQAVDELARRTLRNKSAFARAGDVAAAESSARFAAEYRKLATLATEGAISKTLVVETIVDRGEQDVWAILDAIGSGGTSGASQAIGRLDRYLSAAADPIAARLSFWSLLAGFCRQLTAVSGALSARVVRRGVSSYPSFKSKVAPKLQAPLASGGANPLASLHPYRLHRAYLAASRAKPGRMGRLPERLAETEELLKGGSSSPSTVLTAFVVELATALER